MLTGGGETLQGPVNYRMDRSGSRITTMDSPAYFLALFPQRRAAGPPAAQAPSLRPRRERLQKIYEDVRNIRREFALAPSTRQEGRLKETLRRELSKVLSGFQSEFAQCDQMRMLQSPQELQQKISQIASNSRVWFYVGYTGDVKHYLWEAEPASQWWKENRGSFRKVYTYYCHIRWQDQAYSVQHFLRPYYGINQHCLNAANARPVKPGLVYVLVYKLNIQSAVDRNGKPPLPIAWKEDWTSQMGDVYPYLLQEGTDELRAFLQRDLCQVIERYPRYLKQCREMTEISFGTFMAKIQKVIQGLKQSERFYVGAIEDKLISMRPYLWEVGSASQYLRPFKKLHTYFTRVTGSTDLKAFLDSCCQDPRCLNNRSSRRRSFDASSTVFLYVVKYNVGPLHSLKARRPLKTQQCCSHCPQRKTWPG